MNKTSALALLSAMLLTATPSFAVNETLSEMKAFLKDISENAARAPNAAINFPAFIKSIEVANDKQGAPIALVELGYDNLHGIIMTWGTTKLYCKMSAGEAAKLKQASKVQVRGKVVQTMNTQKYSKDANFGRGGVITDLNLIAQCNISPFQ